VGNRFRVLKKVESFFEIFFRQGRFLEIFLFFMAFISFLEL